MLDDVRPGPARKRLTKELGGVVGWRACWRAAALSWLPDDGPSPYEKIHGPVGPREAAATAPRMPAAPGAADREAVR